jgi:class 3 adenylate cyclase
MDPLKINAFADELLERCARRRLGLRATLDEFLPAMARRFGAQAAAVETLNEDLEREAFHWPAGKRPARGLCWVSRPLDVAGRRVGTLAFGYRGAPPAGPRCRDCLAALCEELDGTLWNIQTAAVKQRLMERVTRCLTRSVLREAIDEAVGALHAEIPFRRLVLVYVNDDASGGGRIQYRFYRGRRCVHDSEQRPHQALDRAIGARGLDLMDSNRQVVRRTLGLREGIAFSLSGQAAGSRDLGKLVAEVEGGLDTFGRDLMRIFANSVSQRLIDYNRERRHLAQFFSPTVVSELLSDPDYRRKHLSPRVKPVAILYADINSFTKLCERALRRPDRIGEFVDHWSEGAVRIAWERGGVFDKMVGDCVIIHFGPPFYRGSDGQNARQALLAAREIQAFTKRLERDPRFCSLPRKAKLKGLGVAVGINLCPAAIGLFGPNQDFTAFSSGMNQAARLQSQAGFRETLAMESAVAAMRKAGQAKGMGFQGPFEVEVKNVAKPLRYYRLIRGHNT